MAYIPTKQHQPQQQLNQLSRRKSDTINAIQARRPVRATEQELKLDSNSVGRRRVVNRIEREVAAPAVVGRVNSVVGLVVEHDADEPGLAVVEVCPECKSVGHVGRDVHRRADDARRHAALRETPRVRPLHLERVTARVPGRADEVPRPGVGLGGRPGRQAALEVSVRYGVGLGRRWAAAARRRCRRRCSRGTGRSAGHDRSGTCGAAAARRAISVHGGATEFHCSGGVGTRQSRTCGQLCTES